MTSMTSMTSRTRMTNMTSMTSMTAQEQTAEEPVLLLPVHEARQTEVIRFVSVDNYKVLLQVFKRQIHSQYGCDVDVVYPEVKGVLYETMLAVQREFCGSPVAMQCNDMNNVVVNMLMQQYEARVAPDGGDRGRPLVVEGGTPSVIGGEDASVATIGYSTVQYSPQNDTNSPPPATLGPVGATEGMRVLPTKKVAFVTRMRYISVSSFDRDWEAAPLRYRYSVTLRAPFREVQHISVGSLLLPAEVRDVPSVHHVAKASFVHNYNLDVPYVVLQVDELGDMYNGANERLNRGFANMIYEKGYCTSYGRAFIVLKPMQPEIKVFEPSPSSLSRLSLSILRPNGDLLNYSRDDQRLLKLEHEAYNPSYLKIITHNFFDKNEFYVGDNVQLRGFRVMPLLGPNGPKDSRELELEEFVNRWNGHDVRQLGRPNQDGFFRWFYIDAPRLFNEASGRLEVRMDLIEALQAFNDRTPLSDPPPPPSSSSQDAASSANILNMSLQSTVSFTVGERIASHAPTNATSSADAATSSAGDGLPPFDNMLGNDNGTQQQHLGGIALDSSPAALDAMYSTTLWTQCSAQLATDRRVYTPPANSDDCSPVAVLQGTV